MQFDHQIKALVFDCDGTLVNSGSIHLNAWRKAIISFNGVYDESFLVVRNGLPLSRIIQDYNQAFNMQINVKQFERKKNAFVQDALHSVECITEISNILIQNYQNYPIAVISGGNRKDVLASLKANGLFDKCELIITADDEHPPKDQPEAYIELANLLNVAVESCHFFEDGYFAIKAARQAGMQVTDVNQYLEQRLADTLS